MPLETSPFDRRPTSTLALVGFGLWLAGCASSEALRVKQVAQRRLRCPLEEIATELNRETPTTREWLAGCEFAYVRVHCNAAGCGPAPVRPPCFGEVPCMQEDPVTLEWDMPESSELTPAAGIAAPSAAQ